MFIGLKYHPISVIGISAKSHIGATLLSGTRDNILDCVLVGFDALTSSRFLSSHKNICTTMVTQYIDQYEVIFLPSKFKENQIKHTQRFVFKV